MGKYLLNYLNVVIEIKNKYGHEMYSWYNEENR